MSSMFHLLDLHVIPIKETRDWCIFVTWFHILKIFIHLVLLQTNCVSSFYCEQHETFPILSSLVVGLNF